MPSFSSEKLLRATIVLEGGNNTFPGTGSNTLVLTNLRMVANIDCNVGFANELSIDIYGMKQADMNALSVLLFRVQPTAVQINTITLEAWSGKGWAQVFAGTIIEGSPQYTEMPDVYMRLQARIGYAFGVQPTTPISYPNGGTVASAMQTVAGVMGLGFENNGVTAMLPKGAYFPGSPYTQLRAIARNSNIDYYIDQKNTLAICPRFTPRSGLQQVVLAPTTGLIADPCIEVFGVSASALFNPQFTLGGPIQITETIIPAANGQWYIFKAYHTLESLKFDGAWFTHMNCSPIQT